MRRLVRDTFVLCALVSASCASSPSRVTTPAEVFGAATIELDDQATIIAWFRASERGRVDVPAVLVGSDDPRGAMAVDPESFRLHPWTPMDYVAADTPDHRLVDVATGLPGPDCQGEGEECEGGSWLVFELDVTGRIVAVGFGQAACPFVYSRRGDALTLEGEILRDLRSHEREAVQRLRLPGLTGACDGHGSATMCELRVVVREDKDEDTRLDDVALWVDGQRLVPRACEGAIAPSYCGDDGRYEDLGPGESLELVFDVPAGLRHDTPTLEANGYYVPRLGRGPQAADAYDR